MATNQSWDFLGQDGTKYMCSSDPSLLDLRAFNAALDSDILWWATILPDDRLQTMVNNSLILAVYLVEPGNYHHAVS